MFLESTVLNATKLFAIFGKHSQDIYFACLIYPFRSVTGYIKKSLNTGHIFFFKSHTVGILSLLKSFIFLKWWDYRFISGGFLKNNLETTNLFSDCLLFCFVFCMYLNLLNPAHRLRNAH